MADDQDIKIAVLENEVRGLREQHKAHKDEITKSLKEVSETFFEGIREIRNDIKNIYAFINQSKGSLAVVILIASGFGGLVVSVMSWVLGHYFK